MSKFIVDINMDGYETPEEHDKACEEFIIDQLDFSGSGVNVIKYDYDKLLTRYSALLDASKKLAEALASIEKFKGLVDYPEHEIRHAIAVEIPFECDEALASYSSFLKEQGVE